MASGNGSARRARDEGSIRVRGEGKARRYQAAYSLTTGGDRKRITRTFRTRRDATRWLNDQLSRKDQGVASPPTSMTVGEMLDAWLAAEGDAARGWQPSHAARNRQHVEMRLKPALGKVKLRDLKPVNVQRMVDALAEPGQRLTDSPNKRTISENRALSGTTQQHILGVLNAAVRWAMKRRFVDHNPVEYVRRPAAEEREIEDHVWTGPQLAEFLAATTDRRDWTLWRLAAFTGMRRGELLGLQWGDVDLDAATVRVRRRRTRVGTEMIEGKSAKTHVSRTIDIDPETVAALRAWRSWLRQERLAAPPGLYHDTPWVFVDEIGRPLTGNTVDGRWRQAMRRVGERQGLVPVIRFHDLRHTHASLLLAAGANPVDVSERLGHANVTMTLDVYSHAIKGNGASVAATFAAVVDAGGSS